MTFCIAVTNAEDEEMEDILITLNGNTEFEVLNDGGFTQQGSSGIWQQLVTIPSTTEVTYCISFRLSPSWDDDPSNKIDVTAQLTYLTCNFGAPYEFNTIIPQFPFITIGSNPQQPILLSQIATYTGTGSPGNTLFHPALSPSNAQNFLLNGTLIVDESLAQFDYVFPDPSSIYMSPGASIIIENEQNLHLLGQNSKIVGCYEMWESITVEDGGGLIISKAKVEDGTNAIIAENGSTVTVTEAKFKNNRIGIQTPDAASGQNINFTVHNNLFESDELKPPLAGQIGEAGLDLNRVNGITLINNRFMNLANGILANRSNMTVVGGSFINMLTDNAPYTFKGYGIRTTGNFNFLNQIGLGTNTNFPTFDNCQYGVYSFGNEVNVSQNAMLNTWIGITTRDNRVKVSLNNNNLFCERFGLNLLLNRAVSAKAENNTITMDDDGDKGTAVRMAEIANPSVFGWVIGENDITLDDARWGIFMNNVGYSNVKKNTVSMNNLKMYEGISIDGGFANFIDCNSIAGADLTNEQRGIGVIMSAAQHLTCNAFDDSRFGINIVGPNSPSFLQGNEFNNHFFAYQIGLVNIGTGNDIGGFTGVQPHHGNRWMQDYQGGALGAHHLGTNSHVDQSRILFDPADDDGTLDTNDIPTDFVSSELEGDTYHCAAPCPIDLPKFNDQITPTDLEIIKETITFGQFSDAQKWTSKRQLYRRLIEDPTLITPGTSVDTFYNDEATTTVGRFENIRKDMANLFVLDGTTDTQMTGYQDDLRLRLDSLFVTDSLINSNPTPTELANLKAQKASLLNVADGIVNSKNTLNADIDSVLIVAAGQIKTTNDNLIVTDLWETNQQTVNSIYLETIINSQEDLTTAQIALIQPIANQCPLEGGEAVFQARTLLNDGTAYNNANLCMTAANRSNENPVLTEENFGFKLYPNPTSSHLTIELNEISETDYDLEIVSLLGVSILKDKIAAENRKKVLNLEGIPQGVYHLKLSIDNKPVHSEVFFKVQ